ncbi:MAG: Y-family DNA polymerase [Candidatus Pacebacteria bacterium]|nr:Y-family DNA polymerase [Candidatus Paceibacterota bacterium]
MKTFALVDCNNFFVSCERVFNPAIKNKPTLVLSCNDGCVISRSQEVKDMGVPMGIPHFKIKENYDVSKIAIFSTNFKLYKDMSDRVMNIIEEFSPEIEVYSIDEAFIDLTSIKNPKEFCEDLQRKIKQYTGIPVSIGIAPTKTLAKLANRIAKDNQVGVFQIESGESAKEILKETSVGKIWGIGSRISLSLSKSGIDSAFTLTNQNNQWIQKNFGIGLLRLVNELRGVSCFAFDDIKEARKSIISSRSFGKPVTDFQTLFESISYHVANVAQQMREEGSATKFLSITISTNRHSKMPQYYQNESIVLDRPISDTIELTKCAHKLLDSIYEEGYEYKKTGVSISDFVPIGSCQDVDLFGHQTFDKNKLMESIDSLNLIYGNGTIKLASEGVDKKWSPANKFISGEFTTNWKGIPIVRVVR